VGRGRSADHPLPDRARAAIILLLWGICALGLALALPAAIEGGFFAVSGWEARRRRDLPGVLVTRPGMSVAEMIRRSTLKLNIGEDGDR